MKKRNWSWLLLGSSSLLLVVGIVRATVSTIPDSALISSTTYYTDQIGGGIGNVALTANDDGSTAANNLGFTLNFFGTNYTQFYINNNGNITFQGPLSSFTPNGPQGATEPVISPFFADVDTRGSGSGLVYLRTDVANEIIVTWNAVGYFADGTDKLDSFQLVLRGPGFTVPAGEGQIGFFYKTMQWEVGGASGGVDGVCTGGVGTTCFPAAVGFGDGASNGSVLQGSLASGIAAIVNDHHIWFNLSGGVPTPVGTPSAVPAPGTLWLIALGIIGLGLTQWMRRRDSRASA